MQEGSRNSLLGSQKSDSQKNQVKPPRSATGVSLYREAQK